MSEKRKRIILSCYLVFVGICCILTVFNHEKALAFADAEIDKLQIQLAIVEKRARDMQSVLASIEQNEDTTPTASQKYIVKEHNGKIGIFLPSGELLREFGVYVKTLPASDRELLRKGIEIGDDSQLYSIIQDYIS